MSLKKKIAVIIAAAGEASRFDHTDIKSKQFILLGNKPLLFYSLEKFCMIENVTEIIIVSNDVVRTESLIENFKNVSSAAVKVIKGGKLRQDSVYLGFSELTLSPDFVIVHDVARPFFNLEDLNRCIKEALLTGAAILAVPVVDTVKSAVSDKDKFLVSRTLNRKELFLIQTPQVISYNLLSQAYNFFWNKNKMVPVFTDEAAMLETLGEKVCLVLGDRLNIKITYPEDLELAKTILKIKSQENVLV